MEKSEKVLLKTIREKLDLQESGYRSVHATPNSAAVRREAEEFLTEGYRQAFSVDGDRILHSRGYARYIDKTQVFYLIRNDHITHRVLHVQLVSKIGRSIGRFLGLNEDLIEAIALGHDIGHTPFGHDGERFLSELCLEHGIGTFQHNVQSVQFLDRVERKGRGWNLNLQTLDGILCHDGEVHNQTLAPDRRKTFETLQAEMAAKKHEPDRGLVPMTLEGCVVRMADTVSYIGRDIEDAIRLGLIRRADLPPDCVRILGDTNGTIVYNLVTDILGNSYEQGHVAFGPEMSAALRQLKHFNLERIYLNPRMKPHTAAIRGLFRQLFAQYLDDLAQQRQESVIFRGFLNGMSEAYLDRHAPAEIVRDFISGMTDQYFLNQCPEHLRPGYIHSQD
jgi:dGTPase